MDDDGVRRRRVLGWTGAAAAVGLAGCSGVDGPRTETGESASVAVRLDNRDDVARAFEVVVDWGEGNRSLFSGTLPAGATGTEVTATTGTAPESATVAVESTGGSRSGEWSPTACPSYRVDAVVEDGTPSFEAGCRS